ncbi:para-aminobenzoate synthase [Geoanaerobacter pelophilus]|uniref:Para-aminobenzoate synthase n=1 Tax=Geoanaerobacter pelophilus TaxID=60036 RepID=A0ABQ0MLI5_9BACT|nr:aminodeoxychorismate synthase component I [Geoanaerobacter pelophilus]GAW67942.1 para-aminobenzoate synthase [Geoanaerobacter pelophilus]
MTAASPAYLHGWSFCAPAGEVCAATPEEVVPALMSLEQQVASGLHAAGFISYEAAGALNGDLATRAPGKLPLLWFGLYRNRSRTPLPSQSSPFHCGDWRQTLDAEAFDRGVRTIRELIAAGDCYQVNFTLRQRFSFRGCPRSFFSELSRSQPTPYGCYIETGNFRILSASPELFFSLSDGVITTRPMKGTAPRGRWPDEDRVRMRGLKESPKELAENLMIVDLLRNDLGMVSETGSVRVASLFDVESHPTVHQMTSTIEGRLREGVGTLELLRALFPCGSVTGAPKKRSMEIIAQLEEEPRGLYTGCIGYLSPGGEAKFSVAIRTTVLDLASGDGEIGVGSGITYDSCAVEEYRESLSKARFARELVPEFQLIESLLYDGEYFLLERHLERLARSAAHFSFALQPDAARRALEETAAGLAAGGSYKVRLLLSRDGRIACEAAPIEAVAAEANVGFASARVDSDDTLLYHKTTLRDRYRDELAAQPELDEVIFENERGEVAEGANSNLVARIEGRYLTPPMASGLLPGTFREELIAQGKIEERVLTRADLEGAEALFLVNSVRKWRRAALASKK